MTTLWTWRHIAAPADVVWDLLTDTTRWPEWGPTVRAVDAPDGAIEAGTRGTITTLAGVRVPFEVTHLEPGARWRWKVGGIGATDHRVEPTADGGCRVGFGVPAIAAPYLAVCRIAAARIDTLATASEASA